MVHRFAGDWRAVVFGAVACSWLLSGCATLDKEECLQGDWRTLGFEDGARGYPLSRVGEHRKACAEYRVQIDLGSYEAGHREGARVFCVPRTAYQLGLRGGTYYGTCPPELESEFLAYHQAGREVRTLRNDLRREQGVLKDVETRYEHTLDAIAAKEAILVSEGLTRPQRMIVLNELKLLHETRVALEVAIQTQANIVSHLTRQVASRSLTF